MHIQNLWIATKIVAKILQRFTKVLQGFAKPHPRLNPEDLAYHHFPVFGSQPNHLNFEFWADVASCNRADGGEGRNSQLCAPLC